MLAGAGAGNFSVTSEVRQMSLKPLIIIPSKRILLYLPINIIIYEMISQFIRKKVEVETYYLYFYFYFILIYSSSMRSESSSSSISSSSAACMRSFAISSPATILSCICLKASISALDFLPLLLVVPEDLGELSLF